MREFFKKVLDEHATKILPFAVGLLSMFSVFLFIDMLEDEKAKPDIKGEIINQTVIRISTEKSKNFLNCIYEQLECYNKNAGLERGIILEACKDIDYCDQGTKK